MRKYTFSIGHAQDVTERLVTVVFSVAWELFGIQNVFVAIPVVNQYTTTRYLFFLLFEQFLNIVTLQYYAAVLHVRESSVP